MIAIGDVHVYVSDFAMALRFWRDGLGLRVAESESTRATGFSVLECSDGGPAIRLFGGTAPWATDERPPMGSRPTVRFDVTTSEFDATLVRLLEGGGQQIDEIEEYDGLRVVTVADPDGNTFELVEIPAGE